MASNFDPYWEWLKIPPNQQPPNHYRLLGLKSCESDTQTIEAAVNRLAEKMQRLSNGPQVEAAQKILNQVAQARLCLNDSAKKLVYDRQLTAKLANQEVANSASPSVTSKPDSGRSPDPAKQANTASRATKKPENLAKQSGDSQVATLAANRQVQLMKYATAAMLVLGGIAGSLFVRFVFSRPATQPLAQQSVDSNITQSTSRPITTKPDQVKPAVPFLEPIDPVRTKTATPTKTDMPTKTDTPKVNAQLQSEGFSRAATTLAKDLGLETTDSDQVTTSSSNSTPSIDLAGNTTTDVPTAPIPPTAATTPAELPPTQGTSLQTISGLPDTFVPSKSSLFESYVNEVVGLQGQVVKSRASSTGATTYLMFSNAKGDLIEIRARAKKVAPEAMQTFVGKNIRVRGEIKKEFGNNVIGMEIETVDQIEIVE